VALISGGGSQCLGDLDSRFLVALPPASDLLLRAKHLLVGAMGQFLMNFVAVRCLVLASTQPQNSHDYSGAGQPRLKIQRATGSLAMASCHAPFSFHPRRRRETSELRDLYQGPRACIGNGVDDVYTIHLYKSDHRLDGRSFWRP
jgi:hypothetical protein